VPAELYVPRDASRDAKVPAAVVLDIMDGSAILPRKMARAAAQNGVASLYLPMPCYGARRPANKEHEQVLRDDPRRAADGMRQTVMDVRRAKAILAARPDVDATRIGITGISWGGYTTSIVMSLDDRLKAAVPVYGCGFLHENSAWTPILSKLPEEERRTWIANFDPSSYLSRCKIPVLWMNGTNDFAYPLDSYRKSYRATPVPETLCVTVKMPHSHPAGWERQEIQLFLDAHLRRQELPVGHIAAGQYILKVTWVAERTTPKISGYKIQKLP
jgi:dienelactone hydrolase